MTNKRSKPPSPAGKKAESKETPANQSAEPRGASIPDGRSTATEPPSPRSKTQSEPAVSGNNTATEPTPQTVSALGQEQTGPKAGDTSAAQAAPQPSPVAEGAPLLSAEKPLDLTQPASAGKAVAEEALAERSAIAPITEETATTSPVDVRTEPESGSDLEPTARPTPESQFAGESARPQEKPAWWKPEQILEPELAPHEPEVVAETEIAEPAIPQEEVPAASVEAEPQHHAYSPPSMFILHVTPELAPVAKVGGLADVVFGLGKELEIRGNHVEFILPKYDCLRYDHVWGLIETFSDLWVPWYGGAIHCTVYFGFVHGRKCFFIEPHSADNFFNRGCIYGFHDDVLRFAFFSRAALEFMWKSGKHPDIIHCHDWQTALVPVFLFEIYQHLGMTRPRVCFTIHNFKHQGVTGANLLTATGLNRPEYYFHYDRLRDNHNLQALNLMKGGVVYANFVTTVSPRHAIEAKDQGEGFGLEPTLHIHHQKYGGVVNGIDYEVWNPEIDRYIPFRYSLDTLDDKYKNKIALRDRLLLADNEKPIVAFIGRLDPQKGLELIRHAIFYTLHRKGQFVLLGSSPDSQINSYFWGLKHQLNENPDCHIEIGFNEELSHLIYSGADIVLVPSRFEPCGLTQLIALRYGVVPVVREVGGLADTVFDKDHSHRPLHERNGYVFRDYDFGGLESALGRAISCYYEYPEHFRELMKNAMRCDYSWKNPGQDYLNIYDFIRAK